MTVIVRKGSYSNTTNTNNSSPINLPALESLNGGQVQSSVGNTSSNIGGLVGNNAAGTVNVLDGGAIAEAFGLADKSVAGVFDLTTSILEQQNKSTGDFLNTVQKNSQDALNYISEQTNSESAQREFLIKVLIGGAALGAIFLGFKYKWGQ